MLALMIRCGRSLQPSSHMKNTLVAVTCIFLAGCAGSLPSPSHFGRQPVNQGAHVVTLSPPAAGPAAPVRQSQPVATTLFQGETRSPINGRKAAETYRTLDAPRHAMAERVFSVYYTASGTKFEPDAATGRDLRAVARTAARIELIGRTDGEKPSASDESIALKRVLAARRFLVDQGVDPTRIYLQYASATGYVGDNSTAFGRSQNRRIDIRIE